MHVGPLVEQQLSARKAMETLLNHLRPRPQLGFEWRDVKKGAAEICHKRAGTLKFQNDDVALVFSVVGLEYFGTTYSCNSE